jgi:hypothetical protein
MTTPYTYLIGWPEIDHWYYGVRFAKGCNPSDFWSEYKTSSKYVKKFILENGEPEIDVIHNDRWLNKTDNRAIDPRCAPKGDNHWTVNNPELSKLMSSSANPMKDSESAAKISGDNHYSRKSSYDSSGHPMKRPEVVNRMKSRVVGSSHYTHKYGYDSSSHPAKRSQSIERMKLNNPSMRFEVATKISESLTGYHYKRVVCEVCGQEVSINQYPKWHGSKCRLSVPNVNQQT